MLSLRCERTREGLKSSRPCTRLAQLLDLTTLVAVYGPDLAVDELEQKLRCPGCGSHRFSLHIALPPGDRGMKDAEPPRRQMPVHQSGYYTLGSTPDPLIVVICDCKGGRRGQYRRETLLEHFDPGIDMPSLLPHIARWRGCGLAIPNPTKHDLARPPACHIRYDVEGI